MKNQNEAVHVAFCVDRSALFGLHVTLASTLHHFSREQTLRVHLIHDGLEVEDIEGVRRTVTAASRDVTLEPKLLDSDIFKVFDAFVGGYMSYARLVMPTMIETDKIIYLDADLIVGVDLAELFKFDLSGKMLGAVTWETRTTAHDSSLYRSLNRSMSLPYYNAGVLLIDSKKWREQHASQGILDFGNVHYGSLMSHDQSLINLYCEGDIIPLPRKYNTVVSPNRRLLSDNAIMDRIIHLVGRPKPWDPLGILNGQYRLFLKYLPLIDTASTDSLKLSKSTALRKVLRSPKSYAKCLIRR